MRQDRVESTKMQFLRQREPFRVLKGLKIMTMLEELSEEGLCWLILHSPSLEGTAFAALFLVGC